MRLQTTTTQGLATDVLADQRHMAENLPTDMDFAPWTHERGMMSNLSPIAIEAVLNAARSEVEQDVRTQCCLDSMYFGGKKLGMFAIMAYAVHDQKLARRILEKLKRPLRSSWRIDSNTM